MTKVRAFLIDQFRVVCPWTEPDGARLTLPTYTDGEEDGQSQDVL